MLSLTETFGPDGALAARLPHFRYRAPQQRMAELVGAAVAEGTHTVIEAGTGIGKTFAYLVPVLVAGSRAILSTGTRTLQDQLSDRDLPMLGQVLGRPVEVVTLKGRANYLCWQRLGVALERGGHSRESADRLAALADWGRGSDTGDLSEIGDLSDDFRTLALVTSTADNCLGVRCEHFEGCFVGRARRRAQAAQVVIVNHHLLLADLSLKDRGFGELLPHADVVVVDEAHLLPEIAQQFFGVGVSSREIERLAADLEDEAVLHRNDDLAFAARGLLTAARQLRLDAGSAFGRLAWAQVPPVLRDALTQIVNPLATVAAVLEGSIQGASERPALERLQERFAGALERLTTITVASPADGLRWAEVTERSVQVHLTPFDVAAALGERIRAQQGTWIFASATLAVGDDFDHFVRRLGIEVPVRETLPSPFDYKHNARLYIPDGIPEPAAVDHTAFFIDAVLPLIEAAGGGAFVLFTSFRALDAAHALLRARRLPWPLLVQGTDSRTRLLEAFRAAGDAVLLGTGSFWQGVDVRGAALRLVAIDKLPFAVPGDPVVQARIEAIRREGGDPFAEFQLPQAVLALKQGVGRLIRDYDDRGLVVLGDPRLRTRSYGSIFMRSLPPMPLLGTAADAAAFAAGLNPVASGRSRAGALAAG